MFSLPMALPTRANFFRDSAAPIGRIGVEPRLPVAGGNRRPENFRRGHSPALYLFRGAQLRAAGSWIAINFVGTRGHRFFRQPTVQAAALALAESVFHSPVLQRVEADDDQPS